MAANEEQLQDGEDGKTILSSAQKSVLALLNLTPEHGVMRVHATVHEVTVMCRRYGLELPVLIAQALGLDTTTISSFTIDAARVTVVRVGADGLNKISHYTFDNEEQANG